jgi:uncharacterized protein (DUF2062 family)
MPKKLIKKCLPNPDTIMNSKVIGLFGNVLHNPSLWHINRQSCSGAVAVGLFCAFIPLPFQMLIAALLAIIFRVNILIAVPVVWITNPITIPPFFYFCYRLGAYILNIETGDFHFELSIDWLVNGLIHIWEPFLLGCFIVSSVTALIGYAVVQVYWRYHIWQHLKKRKLR